MSDSTQQQQAAPVEGQPVERSASPRMSQAVDIDWDSLDANAPDPAETYREEVRAEQAAMRPQPAQQAPQPAQEADRPAEGVQAGETGQSAPEAQPRPSARFQSEEEARRGYDNLLVLQARQAQELGRLRAIAARAEAETAVRAEMQQQQAKPAQQRMDPREYAFRKAYEINKDRYGLSDEEARTTALEWVGLMDFFAAQRVDQATSRIKPLVEEREGAIALQERVNRVALEVDQNTGQYVRQADWKQVTDSDEFRQIVQQEPELINSDLGLRHAYQTAKYLMQASPKAMARDAEKIRSEAAQIIESEKARVASVNPSMVRPTAVPPSGDPEWDEMFEATEHRHYMQGGSRVGR